MLKIIINFISRNIIWIRGFICDQFTWGSPKNTQLRNLWRVILVFRTEVLISFQSIRLKQRGYCCVYFPWQFDNVKVHSDNKFNNASKKTVKCSCSTGFSRRYCVISAIGARNWVWRKYSRQVPSATPTTPVCPRGQPQDRLELLMSETPWFWDLGSLGQTAGLLQHPLVTRPQIVLNVIFDRMIYLSTLNEFIWSFFKNCSRI